MKEYFKKMFYFSNEATKNIIEKRINDIAENKHQSFSNVIEDILLNQLLPKNKEARCIIMDLFSDNSSFNSISSTLERLFGDNASGIQGSSKYDNFLPVVNFCIEYMDVNSTIELEDEFCGLYISGQLEQVLGIIKRTINSSKDNSQKTYLTSQSKFIEKLIHSFSLNISNQNLKMCFTILKDNWEILKENTYTYRCLSHLAGACSFVENSKSRDVLCNIICEISSEWE